MLHRRSFLSAAALAALHGPAPALSLAGADAPARPGTASGPDAGSDPGVVPERVLFGQVAALEGPAAALGRGMRDGIAAAFAEANRAGGVRGRRLDLLCADDGYEPDRSVEVTRRLIEHDRVFALVGPVGTPTCEATQPVASAAQVPFVGAFTGAGFLRDPRLGNVVNLRASYAQEAEVIVARLTQDLRATRVAVFHQNDAFGRAGLDGVRRALRRRGLDPVALGAYERNTTGIGGALTAVRRGRPDAVVMVAAYQPCAEFVRAARRTGMGAALASLSFVDADALARELGPDGTGVAVTQVVPFPHDVSLPVVRRYHAAVRALDPAAAPGFVSLEGYFVGRLVAAALERVAGEPTRRAFLAAFDGAFDLDGARFAFGPGSNQGSDEVFLTELGADGALRPTAEFAGPRRG